VSERSDKIRLAYLRLDEGSVAGFAALFAEGAQWLGVPGSGFDGQTPT
jgi:hypothetical protein